MIVIYFWIRLVCWHPGIYEDSVYSELYHPAGKAQVTEWSMTMYGTETEPGQVVPTPSSQSQGEFHHTDSTHHHVVDTPKGRPEARDPGSLPSSPPSTPAPSSAPPTPTPVPLAPKKLKLLTGCSRMDATGACIGLCLVVVVVHLVVGFILTGEATGPSRQKACCCCRPQGRVVTVSVVAADVPKMAASVMQSHLLCCGGGGKAMSHPCIGMLMCGSVEGDGDRDSVHKSVHSLHPHTVIVRCS